MTKKSRKRLCRESALLAIYSFAMKDDGNVNNSLPLRDTDYTDTPIHIPHDDYEFVKELYLKTVENQGELDKIISQFSTNWDIERISTIDRNILRLAIAEFYFFPEIQGRITINEAIELAKNYGGEDSSRFVNGLLDAILKNKEGDKEEDKVEEVEKDDKDMEEESSE